MYSGNIEIKYTLIVAAAGIGKRMGLPYPKQFLQYKGKPLFVNILEVAENSNIVKDIIVVTKEELIEEVRGLCEKFQIKKVSNIVSGGNERQESIYNALKYCDKNSIIAVQDGVRPFFKERYIEECCKVVVEERAGAVIGVRVKDTIKVIDENFEVKSTPMRANLIAVHTPQAFDGKLLKEAYERAERDGFLGTDDSSLVERIGGRVKIVLGDYDNIKITTQEDLRFL